MFENDEILDEYPAASSSLVSIAVVILAEGVYPSLSAK